MSIKTAEAVTPRHPDKMCDQISDAILDWCLLQDPMARVAVEVLGGHGKVYICGEVTTKDGRGPTYGEIDEMVHRITGQELDLEVNIVQQSVEIANGVDSGGAGDQGIMKGYACNENEALIPNELFLARSLCKFLYEKFPYDGKTQITLEDKQIKTIVASFQNVSQEALRTRISEWIGQDTKKRYTNFTENIQVLCNPAGDWYKGGFDADTGLTGRKLMVDNYGPEVAIGGGCFSGKDGTKVDRSAAYMARHLAVKLLKKHQADEVTVKLAYAIGVAEPVMAVGELITNGVKRKVNINDENLTPKKIIDFLQLRKPQFIKTAEWGHFGNNFPWDL